MVIIMLDKKKRMAAGIAAIVVALPLAAQADTVLYPSEQADYGVVLNHKLDAQSNIHFFAGMNVMNLIWTGPAKEAGADSIGEKASIGVLKKATAPNGVDVGVALYYADFGSILPLTGIDATSYGLQGEVGWHTGEKVVTFVQVGAGKTVASGGHIDGTQLFSGVGIRYPFWKHVSLSASLNHSFSMFKDDASVSASNTKLTTLSAGIRYVF